MVKISLLIPISIFLLFLPVPSITMPSNIIVIDGTGRKRRKIDIDGTGRKRRKIDIGINGEDIITLGDLNKAKGLKIIDAKGLYVTPGFIDLHTHSDFVLLLDGSAESFVRQGVTTQVIGNCGFSCAPLKKQEYLRRNIFGYSKSYKADWTKLNHYLTILEKNGLGTNVIALIGHAAVRSYVMGYENRSATIKEIKKMTEILEESVEQGAFGLSTGLEYFPGNIASEDEITSLLKVIKKYNCIYATHVRNRDEKFSSGFSEAFRISEKIGIKLQISHAVPKYGAPEIASDWFLEELNKEEEKFNLTLEKGLKQLKKMSWNETISGKNAFLLYQSYGFPIEMTQEIAEEKYGSSVNVKEFKKKFKKHQELSRTASAGKFKSGLADDSEATTKLHTATHLLLAALRIVLKDKNIFQKGSNITPERLRLDFSFPRKLTKKELQEVEDLVNAQIQISCEVIREEMSSEQAKKKGALGIFDAKYGDKISVYTIGNFSKEICAGPHVKNTCELGHFKIKKEESSSAGIRRIKAVLKT